MLVDTVNTVDEEDDEEGIQSYTLKELKEVNSRAFEKVLDRMRELEMRYDWWHSVLDDWAQRLPAEFGIHIAKSGKAGHGIYFSMYCSGEGVSFDRAWVDCMFYAGKSAMAQGDLLLKTALEQEWISGLNINSNTRYNYISSVDVEMPGDLTAEDLQGTVFEGSDPDEIWDRVNTLTAGLDDEVKSYVEEVCDSIMEDLEAESDYLTSEEYLLERAAEMGMTFDEDGNEL